eukprot:COSAG01_NODE_8086_length_2925_cov_12.218684_2_plen_282_part_00
MAALTSDANVRAAFEIAFATEVARALDLNPSRITGISIAAGSIVVTFVIEPAADGTQLTQSEVTTAFNSCHNFDAITSSSVIPSSITDQYDNYVVGCVDPVITFPSGVQPTITVPSTVQKVHQSPPPSEEGGGGGAIIVIIILVLLGLVGGAATFFFMRGRQSTTVVSIGGTQESEIVKLTPIALQSASPDSVMTTPIPPTTDTPSAPDPDALGKTEVAREGQANVDARQVEDNISVASFVEEVQPAGEQHAITDLHAMNVKELRGAQPSIKILIWCHCYF